MHTPYGRRHWIIMVIACLIPLLVLGAVYAFGLPLRSVLGAALFLICPLIHLVTMRHMHSTQHTGHEYTQPDTDSVWRKG